MTIEEALARFLVQLQADGRSPHTVRQYHRHVRLLARWAAHLGHSGAVEALDHETLARFLVSREARTRPDGRAKKASAMNALRGSLRVFTGYLPRAGFIPQDPGRLIRRALCAAGPPRALAPEDQVKLLASLGAGTGPDDERDHALFHLLLRTGIRLSAAVGLNVEDLDLAGVDLVAAELTVRTKGDRTERVFLGKDIAEHLRRYVGDRTSGPLFQARGGRRVSTRHVQRRFGERLKQAGIRRAVSCHGLRHGFALGLYRRTRDLLLVKEALHHRSIASTLVYARATAEELRSALA